MKWLADWIVLHNYHIYSSPSGLGSPSQGVVPRTAASPGNLLDKLHILRPNPRPIKSETLGIGPATHVVASPPDDSDAHDSWEPLGYRLFPFQR